MPNDEISTQFVHHDPFLSWPLGTEIWYRCGPDWEKGVILEELGNCGTYVITADQKDTIVALRMQKDVRKRIDNVKPER